jgi:hypothetical protein
MSKSERQGGQVVKDARDITRVRASLGVVIAAKSIESEDLVTS